MLALDDLVDLGEELRLADFKLSPQQYFAALQVILTLAASGALPKERARLVSYVGPIFCSSTAEQRRFPQLYADWLARHFNERTGEPESGARASAHRRVRPAQLRHWWKRTIAAVAVLISMLATWAGYQHWRPREIVGSVIDAQGIALAGVTVFLGEQQTVTRSDGGLSLEVRASELPQRLALTKEGYIPFEQAVGEDLAASRRRLYLDALPVQLDLGSLPLVPQPETASVVIEMPPAAVSSKAPVRLAQTVNRRVDLPPPILLERIVWRDALWTAAPLIAFLLWQTRRIWRRPVLQRLVSKTPHVLREVHLPTGIAALAPALPMRRLAQELRRRRVVHTSELQVELTIAATLAKAGLFTPVLGSRLEPDYLVLVDTAGRSDHQSRLADEVINDLARSDVLIERYTFDRDPTLSRVHRAVRLVRRPHDAPVFALDEIRALCPDHRLLVFSDGAGFFDGFTGAPAPCVDTLLQWQSPTLFTMRPLEQWGEHELALESLGFNVLPLSRLGVLVLMSGLSGAPTPQLARTEARIDRRLPLYRRTPRRWLEREPPQSPVIEQLCAELRADLGERGFAWLAACAAYPELHWGITLRLGKALLPNPVELERTLPALAQLVWFREAYLPDWLRQALLARLGSEDEDRARELLQDLLANVSEEAGSDVPLQIAVGSPRVRKGILQSLRGVLARRKRRQVSDEIIREAPAESPLRDYVFLRFIWGQSVGRLALGAPGVLMRTLFTRGSPLLGFRPALTFVCAALASVAIGLWLGPLHSGKQISGLLDAAFSGPGSSLSSRFMVGFEENDSDPNRVTSAGIAVVDLAGGEQRVTRFDGRWLPNTDGAMSPALNLVAMLEHADGNDVLSVWNLEQRRRVRSFAVGPCTKCISFGGSGALLTYPDTQGRIVVWDARSNDSLPPFGTDRRPESTVRAAALSADGRLLAADLGIGNEVLIWETRPARIARALESPNSTTALAFSPDGSILLAAHSNGVNVWNASSGALLAEIPIGEEIFTSAAVDGANRFVAVSHGFSKDSERGGVDLFDLASGSRREQLTVETEVPLSVAFSPDGSLLASVGLSGALNVWQIPRDFAAAYEGRPFALLVANDYAGSSSALANPVRDARAVAAVLRERYGFGVTLLENTTSVALFRALADLASILQPDDRLLIYLSGHGQAGESEDVYAFLGSDELGVFPDTWANEFATALQQIRAREVLVIVDAAGSLALASQLPRWAAGRTSKTRELIVSYELGQLPMDGRPGVGGPFTLAFVDALNAASGAPSARELQAEVYRRMARSGNQRPSYRMETVGSDGSGSFQFPAPRTPPLIEQFAGKANKRPESPQGLRAQEPLQQTQAVVGDALVRFRTSYGEFVVQLFGEKAPITARNFLRYVDEGFYAGTIFHRIVPDFIVQGGGLTPDFEVKPPTYPPIPNEAGNMLRNERGTVAMARTIDPVSATSQFFINLKDNEHLDGAGSTGQAVFGRIVEGMDVIDRMAATKTGQRRVYSDAPLEAVLILEAARVRSQSRK